MLLGYKGSQRLVLDFGQAVVYRYAFSAICVFSWFDDPGVVAYFA
jgi:hypothetical protein